MFHDVQTPTPGVGPGFPARQASVIAVRPCELL